MIPSFAPPFFAPPCRFLFREGISKNFKCQSTYYLIRCISIKKFFWIDHGKAEIHGGRKMGFFGKMAITFFLKGRSENFFYRNVAHKILNRIAKEIFQKKIPEKNFFNKNSFGGAKNGGAKNGAPLISCHLLFKI